MNPRFQQDSIFKRRKEEWNKDNIKKYVSDIFSSISLLEGWSLIKCEWSPEVKRNRSEELKKNITSSLNIVIKDNNEKEYSYNIQIPDLIHDQFFYIGGYLKVPIFQLYDMPIIFRKKSKEKLIKLKTNSISFYCSITNNEDIICKLFGVKIPIEYIIVNVLTKEEITEFFKDKTQEIFTRLYEKCNNLLNTKNINLIEELGSFYSSNNKKINAEKKGKSIIFSLIAAYECDPFIKNNLKTNNLILEVLQAIHEGERNDITLDNKKIRFLEYILSPLVNKVYELLCSSFTNKKSKFQISQSIILDGCNISDIIHFNFPINAVNEIASLTQTSLTGPGGFKKDSVPAYLRNMDESHYGKICPADTPDRDGCGVILNMVPTVNLDKEGKFTKESEVVCSYPINLTPFVKNDDQIRLQMASSQTKQAIYIEGSSIPNIRSGVESSYLEYSTFLHKAKENGKVVHIDNNYMIVYYPKGKKSEVFNIGYRPLYLNTIDYIEPLFTENQKFKKGDILCSSRSIKEEQVCLGQNLLTAICIWKGYNYEDGIVVRESVAKEKFTSVHSVDLSFEVESGQVLLSLIDDDYSPLPKVGDKLKKGQIYAKIKNLNGEDGFETINMEATEIISPLDCEITSIEIFPNSWNHKVFEFDKFIKDLIKEQSNEFNQIEEKMKNYFTHEEIDKFITLNNLSIKDCENRKGKYKEKGRKLGGIKFKINAIYTSALSVGDKMANRHGNKGIISQVIPDELAPTLEDGRKVDIIINPLGIISRMNVGQLYEIALNECLVNLKKYLFKKVEKKSNKNSIQRELKKFLELIDRTKEKWVTSKILEEFDYNYRNESLEYAIENISLICPPFEDIDFTDIKFLMSHTKTKYTQKLLDPLHNVWINNPVAVGDMYFLKLVHRAEEKLTGRSIGSYSKNTLQPLGGKKKGGAHKLGEMEVWALQAHGASNFLRDLMTIHSDSSGKKNKLLAKIINNPELVEKQVEEKPQSLQLFESYLKAMGLDLRKE